VFAAQVDQRVFDFNCRPLDYVDPSWLDEPQRQAIERLSRSDDTQARALASSWLLEHFKLADTHDFDFTHAAKRLLLLDPPALRDLALLLGLSALTHALRTLVMRSQQLQLCAVLGEPLFDFYTAHVLPRPPVARLMLDTQRNVDLLTGTHLLHASASFGTALLLLGCDMPGSPAPQRARLKFARALGDVRRARRLPKARCEAVVAFCIDCVIHQRHPSWHWLF